MHIENLLEILNVPEHKIDQLVELGILLLDKINSLYCGNDTV